MGRYDNLDGKNIVGKGIVYDSLLLPYIELTDSDILIVTEEEDRLDLLANQFYGNAELWWVIATYNNLTDIDTKLDFDFAEFLKNNEKFEKSISYYTTVLNLINQDHPLYSEATDGRGVAYERILNNEEITFYIDAEKIKFL